MKPNAIDEKELRQALPIGTILKSPKYDYRVEEVLGKGGFGITYMGYDLNMKTRVAIKEYFPVELVTRDTTRRSAGGGGSGLWTGETGKTGSLSGAGGWK